MGQLFKRRANSTAKLIILGDAFGTVSLGGLLYTFVQIDGFTDNVLPLEPLREKWEAVNWHVQEINGRNFAAIIGAVEAAKAIFDKPSKIIAPSHAYQSLRVSGKFSLPDSSSFVRRV